MIPVFGHASHFSCPWNRERCYNYFNGAPGRVTANTFQPQLVELTSKSILLHRDKRLSNALEMVLDTDALPRSPKLASIRFGAWHKSIPYMVIHAKAVIDNQRPYSSRGIKASRNRVLEAAIILKMLRDQRASTECSNDCLSSSC